MAHLNVFAGPNGSGKSTIFSKFSQVGYYVNADEIQRHLGCDALTAAQNAEETRETLLAAGADFTFETVLSTERNLRLMQRAKATGYMIRCIYVLTSDPEINVQRVASRVKRGGHDVPRDKIISRYHRALAYIPAVLEVCDELLVFDNSYERGCGEPSLIVVSYEGKPELRPNKLWTREKLEALVKGQYPERFLTK